MFPPAVMKYVGLPFKDKGRGWDGCDCWGCFRLYQQTELGRVLPSYDEGYATAGDRQEIAALITRDLPASSWRPIPLDEARHGDGLIFRILGDPAHVVTVISPPWFLHVAKGVDACLERWDALQWQKRVIGAYRYAGPDA